jgi:hypothetical protein
MYTTEPCFTYNIVVTDVTKFTYFILFFVHQPQLNFFSTNAAVINLKRKISTPLSFVKIFTFTLKIMDTRVVIIRKILPRIFSNNL